MAIPELSKIQITGADFNRTVKCCYCSRVVNRSILPHIKSEHPEKWTVWKKEMIKSYNQGLNPKKIMKQIFTIDSRPLFTWNVIEKEITTMIEQGCKHKLPIKEKIEYWAPIDEKIFDEMDTNTIWKFRKRGDWATHTGIYRGNWPPQIPRYLIKKYTKPGDWVFDGFTGGGTTIIECRLLGRNAIGYDINPFAIELAKKQLEIIEHEKRRMRITLPPSKINVDVHDVRNLKNIKDDFIDLICTHPPYFNSLKYTHEIDNDLSKIRDMETFLDEMSSIAGNFYRILKTGKKCAILMGDVRIKKNMYPLGFTIMEKFIEKGFTLKDTIIKEQYNDRSTTFYVNQDIRRINHEYLFIFEKQN